MGKHVNLTLKCLHTCVLTHTLSSMEPMCTTFISKGAAASTLPGKSLHPLGGEIFVCPCLFFVSLTINHQSSRLMQGVARK